MILVFGGTTEGKAVAKLFDTEGIPYLYSTKTTIPFAGKGKYISGVMTLKKLEAFCAKHRITHMINAAHPFAEKLHEMLALVDGPATLIRYDRNFPERTVHDKVVYVDSFGAALEYLEQGNFQSLLALSGVQTITKLEPFWKNKKTWFRILDREVSRAIAAKSNFPEEYLLYGFPQEKEKEIELLQKYKPEVILTKESGTNGKLEQKIAAAIHLQIPIVILKRPSISEKYSRVSSAKELLELIQV